jgi:hypothetical protein
VQISPTAGSATNQKFFSTGTFWNNNLYITRQSSGTSAGIWAFTGAPTTTTAVPTPNAPIVTPVVTYNNYDPRAIVFVGSLTAPKMFVIDGLVGLFVYPTCSGSPLLCTTVGAFSTLLPGLTSTTAFLTGAAAYTMNGVAYIAVTRSNGMWLWPQANTGPYISAVGTCCSVTSAGACCWGNNNAAIVTPRANYAFRGLAIAPFATSSTACNACPPGSASTLPGATSLLSCLSCPPGTTAVTAGSPACTPCAPGTYSALPSSSLPCTACPAGSTSTATGATSISSCSGCPLGQYSRVVGATSACSLCPANTYSTTQAASALAACIPCAPGTFSPAGSSACTPRVWTPVNPPFPLAGRSNAVAAANGTAFVAVGGRDVGGALSDVSLGYDVASGALVETRTGGGAPSNVSFDRAAVAAVAGGALSYVFGGVGASGAETGQLWLLNAATGGAPSAQLVNVASTTNPGARKQAGMAYLSSCVLPGASAGPCLVMFGGSLGGALLADGVWAFAINTGLWSKPTNLQASAPGPRSGHAMVASPDGTQAYVFGGLTPTGAVNDVFVVAARGFADATTAEMTNVALGKWADISTADPRFSQRGPNAANDNNLQTYANPVDLCVPLPANYGACGSSGECAPCTYDSSHGSVAVKTCNCNFCVSADNSKNGATQSPWWVVDLGAMTVVDFVNIYASSDSISQARNVGFQIWAGPS